MDPRKFGTKKNAEEVNPDEIEIDVSAEEREKLMEHLAKIETAIKR